MTKSEIQALILKETGIKTSVRQLTGSMKNHTRFLSKSTNGVCIKFDHTWRTNFLKQFSKIPGHMNYHDDYSLNILNVNFDDPKV